MPTHRYYRLTAAASVVTGTAGSTGFSVPWTSIPALASLLETNEHLVIQYAAPNSSLGNAKRWESVFWPGSPGLPIYQQPQDLSLSERKPVNNADFRRRSRRGEIVMAPYSKTQVDIHRTRAIDLITGFSPPGARTPGEGWVDCPKGSEIHAVVQSHYGPSRPVSGLRISRGYNVSTSSLTPLYTDSPTPSVVIPDLGTVDTALVTSALAAATSGQLDLLTEFVELPETLKFVQSSVTDIVRHGVRHKEAVKRIGKLPYAQKVAKLAELELKFRYAVMPIVYSINSVRNVLDAMNDVYVRNSESASFDFELPAGFNGKVMSSSWEQRCFIKQRFDPSDVLRTLRRLLTTNAFSTLWELTPWSFVVDWAFNIGDFIAALTNGDWSQESKCSFSHSFGATFDLWDTNPLAVSTYQVSSYNRMIINPSDHIGLTYAPFMNWKRWLDAASLSYLQVKRVYMRS